MEETTLFKGKDSKKQPEKSDETKIGTTIAGAAALGMGSAVAGFGTKVGAAVAGAAASVIGTVVAGTNILNGETEESDIPASQEDAADDTEPVTEAEVDSGSVADAVAQRLWWLRMLSRLVILYQEPFQTATAP